MRLRQPVLAVALALLGCARSRAATPAGRSAAPATTRVEADTLRVAVGTTGAFDDGRLRVEFRAVEGDSRCPSTALCIWPGDAVVALRLTGAAPPADATLHTHGEPRRADYHGYDVALVRVEPYPDGHAPIDPGAYVAVLAVGRR